MLSNFCLFRQSLDSLITITKIPTKKASLKCTPKVSQNTNTPFFFDNTNPITVLRLRSGNSVIVSFDYAQEAR